MYTLNFYKKGKEIIKEIRPSKNSTILSKAIEIILYEFDHTDNSFEIKDSMGFLIATEEDINI